MARSNRGPLVSEATALPTVPQPQPSGQSYKASTIVIYDSRVLIYERKLLIRLVTGLVVMGGDSYSIGREFESQRRILDGHFSHTYLL